MISILIPVRNTAAYIRQCLESVASQDVNAAHYEVLISDNCSTDDTAAVVERFVTESGRGNFRLIRQEQNLGAYGNLNFLVREAAFDHAHILCADDFYSNPTSLARILAAIEKHPGVAVFAFDNDTCHADHIHWHTISRLYGDDPLTSEQCVKLLFAFGCFLGGLSNIGLNRKLLPAETLFDPSYKYFGDVDFYARVVISGGSICLIREEITNRRHHEGSISSTANRNSVCASESINTVARLERALITQGYEPWRLRAYASWLITQYYHAALKPALKGKGLDSLRNVCSAHRDLPEFWPAWGLIPLSLANWLPIVRRPLHSAIEAGMIRYLCSPHDPTTPSK